MKRKPNKLDKYEEGRRRALSGPNREWWLRYYDLCNEHAVIKGTNIRVPIVIQPDGRIRVPGK